MNRTLTIIGIASSLALAISGCSAPAQTGSAATQDEAQKTESSAPVKIKSSDDPHIQYVKNYVGMNARQVGYTALDKMRHDRYGDGTLKIVFVTPDGSHIDLGSDENDWDDSDLQDWKVVSQNLKPNTEFTYTFTSDSDDEDSDDEDSDDEDSDDEDTSFVSTQTVDEIVLSLAKVGSTTNKSADLTKINPATDKYTYFIKDYVGRNLADCGYLSLANTFNDSYGPTYIKFDIVSEDGAYIDPTDSSALASYVVVSQNVAPNSELKLVYSTDSNGEEDSNLVSSKSIDSVALTVKKIK